MKMKKLLALLLSCLLVVSLFAACGGEEEYEEPADEEYVEDEAYEDEEPYEDEEEPMDEEAYEEEEPAEGEAQVGVSDEVWERFNVVAAEFAKYSAKLKTMSPEEASPELQAYLNEINPRVMEVAAFTRDQLTDEECEGIIVEVQEWTEGLSQYMTVD